jgi:hypothetical protein
MKTNSCCSWVSSLCFLKQTALGQTVTGCPPNADPDRLRVDAPRLPDWMSSLGRWRRVYTQSILS